MSGVIRVMLTCDEEHTDREPGFPCTFEYWGEVLGANSHALHMRVDRFHGDAYSAHPERRPVGKARIPWSRIVNIGAEGWLLHAAWTDDDTEATS